MVGSIKSSVDFGRFGSSMKAGDRRSRERPFHIWYTSEYGIPGRVYSVSPPLVLVAIISVSLLLLLCINSKNRRTYIIHLPLHSLLLAPPPGTCMRRAHARSWMAADSYGAHVVLAVDTQASTNNTESTVSTILIVQTRKKYWRAVRTKECRRCLVWLA